MAKHSKYSASSAKRWINCPASIQLTEKFPVPQTSEFALEGTVAHELAHNALLLDSKASLFENTILEDIKLFPVTKVMADHVQGYVDFIEEVSKDAILVEFEKRVTLGQIGRNLYGTCDCIIVKKNELVVIDFKYGAGISVSAKDNYQMMYYALGANQKYKKKNIRMYIYQPRDPMSSPLKEHSITSKDLKAFELKIVKAIEESKKDKPRFKGGEYCNFCPCLKGCPELGGKALAVAGASFETEISGYKPPDVRQLSSGQISHILKLHKPLSLFLNNVKNVAKEQLEMGLTVPGFELKPGVRRRKWADSEKAIEVLMPVLGDDIFKTDLKTPAQIDILCSNRGIKDMVQTKELVEYSSTNVIKEKIDGGK